MEIGIWIGDDGKSGKGTVGRADAWREEWRWERPGTVLGTRWFLEG